VLERLELCAADPDFWVEAAAGVAVFGSVDDLKVFKLRQPVPELLSVADRFQIKPLIRAVQWRGRYQLLALTAGEARLHEGTRDTLELVDLEGAPMTIAAALERQLTKPYTKVTRGHGSGAGGGAPGHHGQGERKDERPVGRGRFLRVIDREILERASRNCCLPLVLAALPEHQRHFRMLSHNPFLIATGIAVDPGTLSSDELREAAWQAAEPYLEERLRALVEAYGEARGHGRGSDRLEEIATALAAGRVGTLLLEANRRIPGSVDAAEGTVLPYLQEPQGNGAASAGAADVLEELAGAAVRTGAEVIVLEADRMPTRSGAAAVFRH
jgi:Bacterial archaeo-eukaryotic release factor family 3